MSKSIVIFKRLLLAGAVYFLGVSIVHMLGIKIPLLYVYFNVPSYAYQDRIISFLSLGWSVFLFTAFTDPVKNRDLAKAIIVAGLTAIVGLSVINSATDFRSLAPNIHPAVFWMETLGLCAYVASLGVFYYRATKKNKN